MAGSGSSSSAGGTLPPDLAITPSPKKGKFDKDFTPNKLDEAAYTGVVFLDRVSDGKYTATHVITQEQRLLPPGDWECVTSDDNHDVLFVGGPDGDSIIVAAEHFSKFTLFNNEVTKEVFVECRSVAGTSVVSLESISCRFKSGSAELNVPPSNANIDLELYVFHRPRDMGSRVFWSLQSLYKALKLKYYSNTPSKWTYFGVPSWRAALGKVFGDQKLFILSTHTSGGSAKESACSFTERCLPHTCMASSAMLWLLLRWGLNPKRHGGFADFDPQMAASAVAKSLIASAASSPFVLQVSLVQKWT